MDPEFLTLRTFRPVKEGQERWMGYFAYCLDKKKKELRCVMLQSAVHMRQMRAF